MLVEADGTQPYVCAVARFEPSERAIDYFFLASFFG